MSGTAMIDTRPARGGSLIDLDGLDGVLEAHQLPSETPPTAARKPRRPLPGLVLVGLACGPVLAAISLFCLAQVPGPERAEPSPRPATTPPAEAASRVVVEPPAVEMPPSLTLIAPVPAEPWVVYFALDSVEPRPAAAPAWVQACGRLQILGHTDARGASEVNRVIGLGRAVATYRMLGREGSHPQDVLRSEGESRPAVTGDDRAAAEKNRRVEVTCLEP